VKGVLNSGIDQRERKNPLKTLPEQKCQPSTILRRAFAPLADLHRQAGVDRAVIYGVLQQIWSIGTGVVTLLLIAFYFSPEIQGYYFSFASLLALQLIAELGLGQVIMQFASHEWAQLKLDDDGRIVGDPEALSRLVSIGRFAIAWYLVAAILLVIVLIPAGGAFFGHARASNIQWSMPWLGLCLVSGLTLCTTPLWALLLGCNQTTQIYRFRFIENLVYTASLWPAIMLGCGLWVPLIVTSAKFTYHLVFLWTNYPRFFEPFLSRPTGKVVSWRTELLNLQWRFALSWFATYSSSALFTPAAFRFQGATIAGQMGMTWNLTTTLSSISGAFVQTKAPALGVLVASRKYEELDRLTLNSAIASIFVATGGALAFWALVYWLNLMHSRLASRLLPPLPTGLFLAATVLLQVAGPFTTYVRAHKREPLMGVAVVSGVLIALSTWYFGRTGGPTAMAVGYLLILAGTIPVTVVVWTRFRSRWRTSATPFTPILQTADPANP
jgi:hypothetical protein